MRSRIASLLAIPLAALMLLVAAPSPANADTGNADSGKVIFHQRRTLHLTAPSTGPSIDSTDSTQETCFWDVFIFRADASGRISGATQVSCDSVMAQIQAQVVLLNNGNPRGDASLNSGFPNTSFWETRLNFPVACLSGVNQAYGAVYVQSYSGLAASDFGYSASVIYC